MRPGPCPQGAQSGSGWRDRDNHRPTHYSVVQARTEVSAGSYQSQKPNIVLCVHACVCVGDGVEERLHRDLDI